MGSNTSSSETGGNESKVSYERLSLFFLQEQAKNNKKRKIQKYNRFISRVVWLQLSLIQQSSHQTTDIIS